MITSLFFFFTACMAADDGYTCNINIYLVSQAELVRLWEDNAKPDDEDHSEMRGMHLWLPVYNRHLIYIVEESITGYTMLGCTVLWHELLHARGFDHEEMPLCKWKPRLN